MTQQWPTTNVLQTNKITQQMEPRYISQLQVHTSHISYELNKLISCPLTFQVEYQGYCISIHMSKQQIGGGLDFL